MNKTVPAILGGEKIRTRPFSPWPQYKASDIERLTKVVESRYWGGFPLPSPWAAEFAEKFAAMHGAKYGLCLANGTIAITAALQAAGLKYGDEVIVPAYTWDGTAIAVLQAGGVPIFADVDPDTYCLDVKAARRAVTPRTRAIVPVHLAMRFADMNAIRSLASEYKLLVVEDCAHAHGGECNGYGAGAAGDAGTFSFQESKLLTSGEGGMVITSKLECYEVLQTIVNCGRKSITDEFQIHALGSNYRMTELQASLLIGQLEMLPELREKRTKHAALLTRELAGIPGIRTLPPQPGITRETLYNYVFQYRPQGITPTRDLFVAAIDAEGIPCDGRFYEPVYRSDLFFATPENSPQLSYKRSKPLDYSSFSCPVSERAAYHESVWVPQFTLLGDEEDVRDIARAVAKVAANLDLLYKSNPNLAGVKGMSRAERPRVERKKHY
jgi:dTDP-4-amino-4,6-dideoxygalactose transaminase